MKPKALSLFTGAGGMDIGVLQAGFDVLACVENDPHCCETLNFNLAKECRKTKVIEHDVRELDPTKLMANLKLKVGELALLFGGPPCQAFSQIGKQKGLKDERGLLLFQMVRFAEVFQPKVIFIEQVKGLLSAKDKRGLRGEVFEKFISELENLGYISKWQIINAANYGVAQTRQRVFIVSTKKPNGFQFPAPTRGPKERALSLLPIEPYFTVGQAILGLRRPSTKNGTIKENSHVDVTPKGDRIRIHGVPEGAYLAGQTHLPKEQIKNLTKKDTTKYLRLSRTKPSNTLRCGEIFFHPVTDRYLTPRECMRIHGFPDEYILKGPIRSRSGRVRNLDQHRQVANSVPPPVAKVIADEIMKLFHA
ncbi:MAG TPA: DNA cytosine methyltransferase [Nitrospirae bacterium]|nr:DNA cytosine methyltransferase [Nitrospirota bacterium]